MLDTRWLEEKKREKDDQIRAEARREKIVKHSANVIGWILFAAAVVAVIAALT